VERAKADKVFAVAGKLDPSRLGQSLNGNFSLDALDLFEGYSGLRGTSLSENNLADHYAIIFSVMARICQVIFPGDFRNPRKHRLDRANAL